MSDRLLGIRGPPRPPSFPDKLIPSLSYKFRSLKRRIIPQPARPAPPLALRRDVSRPRQALRKPVGKKMKRERAKKMRERRREGEGGTPPSQALRTGAEGYLSLRGLVAENASQKIIPPQLVNIQSFAATVGPGQLAGNPGQSRRRHGPRHVKPRGPPRAGPRAGPRGRGAAISLSGPTICSDHARTSTEKTMHSQRQHSGPGWGELGRAEPGPAGRSRADDSVRPDFVAENGSIAGSAAEIHIVRPLIATYRRRSWPRG